MSYLTVPGVLVHKFTYTVTSTSSAITYPTITPSRRKANAVLLINNHATEIVNINIDGTAAASGFGFTLGAGAESQRYLLFYGLPNLTGVSSDAVDGTGIEVYLLHIPNLGV